MSYTAKNITVLDGLDPVRKTPGMYIGSTGRRGLNHLIYEIVDNSVDEHLAGFCTQIKVTLEKDGSATIEDNGRGIPVDLHAKGVPTERVIFTTLHAGGKFDKSSYKTSGGLHGVGSSVVNALSTYLDVQIKKDGVISYDRYEKGKPVVKLVNKMLPVLKKTKETGTIINFLPDPSIFTETTRFKSSAIQQRLHETAYLNPNLTIIFHNKRDDFDEITFHEPDGLIGYIRDLTASENPLFDTVYIKGEKDGIQMECAFTYINEFKEEIYGFVNNIYTEEGGTHINGFKNSFAKLINNYAREIGVLKEKDKGFVGNDTRNGMVAVLSVKHPEPRFEGQTKTKLDNTDALNTISNIINAEGQLYFDRHLDVLKQIIERAEEAAKLRKNEEKTRINLNDKKFTFEGNGKLARQESNKPDECELFIVEGDSAGGSAKLARDRHTQAILPIRGKILNVEKAGWDKILSNQEIRTIIHTIGAGYGDEYTEEKVKYNKCIIMADSDVDGQHISTLLMTMFYRLMPEYIQNGHVYIAMSPLYRVELKSTVEYLYTENEMAEFQKKNKQIKSIQRYKGLGEMDFHQLWDTTMDPEKRMLKKVSIEDLRETEKATSLLMGNQVEPRRNWIVDMAQYAEIDS